MPQPKGAIPWNKGLRGVVHQSPAAIEKRVAKLKGRSPSAETRRKISESEKGKVVCAETRQKLREAGKKRWRDPAYRKHMSEVHKGQQSWLGQQAKKGICLNTGRTHFEPGHQPVDPYPKGHTPWNKGKTLPQLSGPNHPRWKGGYQNRLFLLKRRRMREHNAPGSHTLEEWEKIKILYGSMCVCCKRIEPEIKLTEDHIIPVSKGGSDYITNIQPLCQSCNSRKSAKIISYIDQWEDLP